jgi:hypothetical protein
MKLPRQIPADAWCVALAVAILLLILASAALRGELS